MNINAVNTLEVRLIEQPAPCFESLLKRYATLFVKAKGCVAYSITQGPHEQGLWVFSGYWSSASDMTAHFSSGAMTELVNHLVESSANLTFASFAAPFAEAQCDDA